jgi:septation ring formation regulator EzrA
MADRINMSGDFRGAVVNIKSTLTNVQQSVGDIRTDDQNAREELETLIGQLSEALQKVPAKNQEHAEAVAETAKALVDTAKAEKPNKTLVQVTAQGLKLAAQNLAEVMPSVVTLATRIAVIVSNIINT